MPLSRVVLDFEWFMAELSNKSRDTGFVGKTRDVIAYACDVMSDCVTMTKHCVTHEQPEPEVECVCVTSSSDAVRRLSVLTFEASVPFLMESLVGKNSQILKDAVALIFADTP